jgi:hypothetical protein
MDILTPIELKHNLLFGTEIEFDGVNIWNMDIPSNLNLKLILDHKAHYTDFSSWILDADYSITKERIGGEVSSKIMNNSELDYEELKSIVDYLKSCKAFINDNCSNHVHISIKEDYNLSYFLEVFSKVVALYEAELTKFFAGEMEGLRSGSFVYASRLNPTLLDKVLELDYKDASIYYRLLYGKVSLFTLRSGINLQNLLKTKQLEFRYPNGTLNEDIIKNNIRMCLLIIDAILEHKFDIEELNQLIIEKQKKNICNFLYDIENDEAFDYLIDIISPNKDEKKLLKSQYNGDFNLKK